MSEKARRGEALLLHIPEQRRIYIEGDWSEAREVTTVVVSSYGNGYSKMTSSV